MNGNNWHGGPSEKVALMRIYLQTNTALTLLALSRCEKDRSAQIQNRTALLRLRTDKNRTLGQPPGGREQSPRRPRCRVGIGAKAWLLNSDYGLLHLNGPRSRRAVHACRAATTPSQW